LAKAEGLRYPPNKSASETAINPLVRSFAICETQNKNAGSVSLQAGVEYCCVLLNRQITREYTTGLPSRLTRFRAAADAHAPEIIAPQYIGRRLATSTR
jgi:hypothetical protein